MKIDQIISKMTLSEKVGQLNQYLYGWECYEIKSGKVCLTPKFTEHVDKFGGLGAIYGLMRADPWSGTSFENGLTISQSQELVSMVNDYVMSASRYQILPFIVEEMPHGHQALNSINYPVNLATAASFNPNLYGEVLKEQAEYAQQMGINIGLYSGLDICKNSKWGRSEETFGSDPLLASKMTEQIAKVVKQPNLTACLKHFVAQGQPYMGLNSGAVNIGQRELYEIHLPPTKSACENGVDVIMAAYNEIDGIPCHANKQLLSSILREQLQFQGIIMADGCALDRLVSPNVSSSSAAKIALNAGVDLSLWDEIYHNLETAVNSGVVPIDLVDEAVTRVLKLKDKLGLIGQYRKVESISPNLNSKLNLNIAEQSIILQNNQDEYLPISKTDTVAVIGDSFQDLYTYLGDYTSFQDLQLYPSLAQALLDFNSNCNFMTISEAQDCDLTRYSKIIVIGGGTSKRDFSMQFEANGALVSSDTTTDCGEGSDVNSVALPKAQHEICEKLASQNLDYCFITIGGRPYALEAIFDNAAAIITNYYNGQQGPLALANVLTGACNPSGKNPITIPKHLGFECFEYNSKQDNRNANYVAVDNSCFEFGHGLSYSQFEYSQLEVNKTAKGIEITVKVANTADLCGLETVQLYVKKSNTIITKRHKELIDFKKVEIAANSSVQVHFNLNYEQLMVLGLDYKYIFENGEYIFTVGTGLKNFLEQQISIKIEGGING